MEKEVQTDVTKNIENIETQRIEPEEAKVVIETNEQEKVETDMIAGETKNQQAVSTAKAGTVEQRERSEEGAAESDKGSKSKLPLASCGVYQQGTFFVIASQREQQRVATLHKEQEHQQSTQ